MKHVVCIDDSNWVQIQGVKYHGPNPIKGEIYVVLAVWDYPGMKYYELVGFKPLYGVKRFRPVDDTFGEETCADISEKIKKEDLQTIEV